MHAWLAKALDRWVIQAAARSMRPAEVRASELPDRAEIRPESDLASGGCLKRCDFRLAPDGTFQFRSLVQTASSKNNQVWGRLDRAEAVWAGRPTVILLHGWNAELCYRYLFPRLASRFARAGINTVMFELPYHMHRRPQQGPVRDFISTDLPGMLEATRQAMADTQVLCRWLETRGVRRIGLWGFSLGAWLTGLVARFEPELSCAVLTTPIARIDRAIAELPFCAPVRHSLADRTIDLESLNLRAARPQLAPGQTLLVAAAHDVFAPRETLEELWEAWERPEMWRPEQGHISVLASGVTLRESVRWVRERLR